MKTVNTLLTQETVTDEEIMAAAYGIKYFGDFVQGIELERLRAMRQRLTELESQKRATATVQPRVTQADCGHWVRTTDLMTTSRGTACPQCYDRMSD